MRTKSVITLLLFLNGSSIFAAELHVAVAANFSNTMHTIVDAYQAKHGHEVKISSGSTGKLYAQIKHGAPFDLFFAADTHRPGLLEQDKLAATDSRFTYAIGQLLLWSPQLSLVDSQGDVLTQSGFEHLAIANPKLAPYGAAAKAVLQHKGVWKTLRGRMVRGENISQTFHFVQSGNAELGFVALSQLTKVGIDIPGSYWLIPKDLYPPIEQQAVILRDSIVAREFVEFIQSDESAALIRSHGYRIDIGEL
ncbi:MAG: molybdate ABC transporter substrate-binding protein [Gammaproteobacteria bacterium]|nr:molybdate ABC transporter substrate-binding protein [Gammaproteobacteria bacterium]